MDTKDFKSLMVEAGLEGKFWWAHMHYYYDDIEWFYTESFTEWEKVKDNIFKHIPTNVSFVIDDTNDIKLIPNDDWGFEIAQDNKHVKFYLICEGVDEPYPLYCVDGGITSLVDLPDYLIQTHESGVCEFVDIDADDVISSLTSLGLVNMNKTESYWNISKYSFWNRLKNFFF